MSRCIRIPVELAKRLEPYKLPTDTAHWQVIERLLDEFEAAPPHPVTTAKQETDNKDS